MARQKKDAVDPGAAGTYGVKSALQHDGEAYGEGDEITLTEAAAAPLVDAGVIEAKAAKAAPKE